MNELIDREKVRVRGGEPAFGDGRLGRAAKFDGKRSILAPRAAIFHGTDEVSFAAWVHPEGQGHGAVLAVMGTLDDSTPQDFSIHFREGRLQVFLGPRWLDDAVRVETVDVLPGDRWQHLAVTYDGSQFASGVKIFVDGEAKATRTLLDHFTGEFKGGGQPLLIGAQAFGMHFRGRIDELRFYRRRLSAGEIRVLANAPTVDEILATRPGERTPRDRLELSAYFLRHHAPENIREAQARVSSLESQLRDFVKSLPTTMVMREREEPRPTHVLMRGEYDRPGERVFADVPASLNAFPDGAPRNRLGFARWLVDPAHPLTSRVAVNRYWKLFFGEGLVRSVEDFGSQGAWPSHPELLDWLATEFLRLDWNVKALQRLIVTSSTYRQSSRMRPELAERDPGNRLLARMPRLRLTAEMVRDQALLASGLLVGRIGGPSVKPYQPPGLWKEIAEQSYEPDRGAKLYRRSLYTFWKRTVPPPAMTTFDAGSRETCSVTRSRTNTPLQALALMNDVTYVEAARALGRRMMREGGGKAREGITWAFRRVTGRRPTQSEIDILLRSHERQLAHFRADPQAARLWVDYRRIREEPKPALDAFAASTYIASLLLNLDEAIMRE